MADVPDYCDECGRKDDDCVCGISEMRIKQRVKQSINKLRIMQKIS